MAATLRHTTVDQVGVEERVSRFTKRSIKNAAKEQGLRMALSMIDLTTLEGKDTEGKVRQMCYKAAHLHDQLPGLPTVAAVCVYPNHVATAVAALKGTGHQGGVCGYGIPLGQFFTGDKTQRHQNCCGCWGR
jgi:deoxyribose-phosphate aldolase